MKRILLALILLLALTVAPARAMIGDAVPGGGIITSIQYSLIGTFYTAYFPGSGEVIGFGPF